MNIQKELLLFVATTLVSVGAVVINNDTILGMILMILGAGIFVGRGFYKKYLDKPEPTEKIREILQSDEIEE